MALFLREHFNSGHKAITKKMNIVTNVIRPLHLDQNIKSILVNILYFYLMLD